VAIRIMLVDDSAIVRGLITQSLKTDPDIQVIATAGNGAIAIPLAKQHQPDVIVLDIEMPEMDGITALPKLLAAAPGVKIIMASTLTLRNADISLQALQLGASDCVAKPSARDSSELDIFYRELKEKIHALTVQKRPKPALAPLIAPLKPPPKPITLLSPQISPTPIKAIAIASSTGGPQALMTLLTALKGQFQNIPVFITQHMPPTFTTILAQHLSKASERPSKEGVEGEVVTAGHVYIAPGNFHMIADKRDQSVVIHINQDPPENFCRPAADPMLRSLSKIYGAHLLVIVLTGMGADGLEGAKKVVENGGRVIAQDEASSVVWGMPGAVAEHGLCQAVLPLTEIAPYLIRTVRYAP